MDHADCTAQSKTSSQSRYVIRAGELAHDSYGLDLTPERAGWEWSSLCMAVLAPGKPLIVPAGKHEYLVLPLSGGCTVQASGKRPEVAGHESVFTDITDYVYISRHTEVVLISTDGTRIALPDSKAITNKPLCYCPHSEVGIGPRGVGPSSRQVNNYALGNNVETSHLLVCKVLTPGGSWSFYPPCEHDRCTKVERVPEKIYYYQVRAGEGDTEGFALQRIYPSSGHDIDVYTEVRDGGIVIMPYDYHGLSAAAPGHDLYHLNVMADPVEDSMWLMIDGLHHTWVRQTREGQKVDPRLPMTLMNDQLIRPSTAPPSEKSREESR